MPSGESTTPPPRWGDEKIQEFSCISGQQIVRQLLWLTRGHRTSGWATISDSGQTTVEAKYLSFQHVASLLTAKTYSLIST